MCIIIYKKKGIKFPEEKKLKDLWDRNDDGAGVAIRYNNRVFFTKGMMEYKDFLEYFKTYLKPNEKDIECVIHFRLGSPVKPELTHPFPLDDDIELLKLNGISRKGVLFHNGVISSLRKKANEIGLSDTATLVKFFRESEFTIENIIKFLDYFEDGDRFLLMTPAKVFTFGNWNEENGVLYSSYPYTYRYIFRDEEYDECLLWRWRLK
ncbi:MAG: hypothetical protein QXX03_05790 [Nitrososphaerota archaeon]